MDIASQLLTEAQKNLTQFSFVRFNQLLTLATPNDWLCQNSDAQGLHMLLAFNGHELAFRVLCEYSPVRLAHTHREGYAGRTLAHFAILHADGVNHQAKANILELILAAGADPNAQDDEQQSLVSYAVADTNPSCLALLFKYKASATEAHLNKAQLLLDKGNGDEAHHADCAEVLRLVQANYEAEPQLEEA